ncbi:MAG: hypothetical protein WD875_11105 [Pirellulales bacterium]
MRCEAFEDRLQHLLDERQLPEEDVALADHAAACPTCREVLDTQAGLFDTVRDWSVSNLEVDLVDRVLVRAAAASASTAPRRSWWPAHWRSSSVRWISIAVAAALLAVAWKGYSSYGPNVALPPTPAAPQPDTIEPGNPSGPQDLLPLRSFDFGPLARTAAEDLGSRLALGVHYIHRGQAVVADVILGHFPRKAEEPNARSSSLLLDVAVGAVVMS